MARGTKNSRNQARKRVASKRPPENQQTPPPAKKQRVKLTLKPRKPAKFIDPELSHSESSKSSPPSSSSVEEPEDVSQQEFTLAKSIMLGSVSIYADSLIAKLGEFKYRDWEVESIRRLDKATEAKKIKFEWSSGNAVIAAKGISKAKEITIDVEESSDWEKVETFVQKWMRDHKKDITVRLTVNYTKVRHSTHDDSSSDEERGTKRGRKVLA